MFFGTNYTNILVEHLEKKVSDLTRRLSSLEEKNEMLEGELKKLQDDPWANQFTLTEDEEPLIKEN